MNQWQPIENAPKDGTHLLLVDKWGTVEIGYWCQPSRVGYWTTNYTCADNGSYDIDNPTHWMPLPEPPK